MKLLLTLLGLCFPLNIWAQDLSLSRVYPDDGKQFKAGYEYDLAVLLRTEDRYTNSVDYTIYYRWNNDTPYEFDKGHMKPGSAMIPRRIKVPDSIQESTLLSVYLVSKLDTNPANDTVKIKCSIKERYAKDIKVSLINPGEKANLRTGIQHPFQFKIINDGSETFPKGAKLRIGARIDAINVFKDFHYEDYNGKDIKSGDSALYSYPVTIPEHFDLSLSVLCVSLDWIEYREGLTRPVISECDHQSNTMCKKINTIGLSKEKPETNIRPKLNLRNQQLSFINKAHNLPYSSIQVFNLSGQLLMSNAINDNRQAWNLPISESTVLVLLSGPKESHRQLIVAQ